MGERLSRSMSEHQQLRIDSEAAHKELDRLNTSHRAATEEIDELKQQLRSLPDPSPNPLLHLNPNQNPSPSPSPLGYHHLWYFMYIGCGTPYRTALYYCVCANHHGNAPRNRNPEERMTVCLTVRIPSPHKCRKRYFKAATTS